MRGRPCPQHVGVPRGSRASQHGGQLGPGFRRPWETPVRGTPPSFQSRSAFNALSCQRQLDNYASYNRSPQYFRGPPGPRRRRHRVIGSIPCAVLPIQPRDMGPGPRRAGTARGALPSGPFRETGGTMVLVPLSVRALLPRGGGAGGSLEETQAQRMGGEKRVPASAAPLPEPAPSQKSGLAEKTQMESNSGEICRTSGFRWVRTRVKIVSQDNSWPGKQRQGTGGTKASRISLFSNFLVGFTVWL